MAICLLDPVLEMLFTQSQIFIEGYEETFEEFLVEKLSLEFSYQEKIIESQV